MRPYLCSGIHLYHPMQSPRQPGVSMLPMEKLNLRLNNLLKTIPSRLTPKFIVVSYPTGLLNNSIFHFHLCTVVRLYRKKCGWCKSFIYLFIYLVFISLNPIWEYVAFIHEQSVVLFCRFCYSSSGRYYPCWTASDACLGLCLFNSLCKVNLEHLKFNI